jgi:hypothetical protein
MKLRNKKQKDEEKFDYRPSKLVIISAMFIVFLLTISKTNPTLFAISQGILFLSFVCDIELQKQRRGE